MNRAVAIWLCHSDVIFEAVGNRAIHPMNDAEDLVALLLRFDQEPHAEEIVEIVSTREALFLELSEDTIGVFLAREDHGLFSLCRDKRPECPFTLGKERSVLLADCFHHFFHGAGFLGIEDTECECFELVLECVDTESCTERCEDIECLACSCYLILGQKSFCVPQSI